MNETFRIMLWSTPKKALDPAKDFQPYMNAYLLNDGAEHGAVIVFPGGGYSVKMMTYEGEDVALKFNELGFHAFVVDYRCGRDARESRHRKTRSGLSNWYADTQRNGMSSPTGSPLAASPQGDTSAVPRQSGSARSKRITAMNMMPFPRVPMQ